MKQLKKLTSIVLVCAMMIGYVPCFSSTASAEWLTCDVGSGYLLSIMNDVPVSGLSYAQPVYCVKSGGILTIENGKIDLTGEEGIGVKVESGGTLILNGGSIEGAIIGISLAEGGTVVMNGGSITGCSAFGISSSGLLILNGGKITDNYVGVHASSKTYLGGSIKVYDNNINEGGDLVINSSSDAFHFGAFSDIEETIYSTSAFNGANICIKHPLLQDLPENSFVFQDEVSDSGSLLESVHANDGQFLYINDDGKLEISLNQEILVSPLMNFSGDIDEFENFQSALKQKGYCSGAKQFEGEIILMPNGNYLEKIIIHLNNAESMNHISKIAFDGVQVYDDNHKSVYSDDQELYSSANSMSDLRTWAKYSDTEIVLGRVLIPSNILEISLSGIKEGDLLKDATEATKLNGTSVDHNSFKWFKVEGGNATLIEDLNVPFEKGLTYTARLKYLNDPAYTRIVVKVNGQKLESKITDDKKTSGYIYNSDLIVNYTFNPESKRSSGTSKKYTVKDDEGNLSKVKKGSTVKVQTEEGRKVKNVTAIDSKGNLVPVTLNSDGTYSYIQPASNVTINVEYIANKVKLFVDAMGAEIDGKTVNEAVKTVRSSGEVMLPLRYITEQYGGEVLWSASDPNKVSITYENKNIELNLNSNKVVVDGGTFTLEHLPYVEGDRTYLSVDFFRNELNKEITFGDGSVLIEDSRY